MKKGPSFGSVFTQIVRMSHRSHRFETPHERRLSAEGQAYTLYPIAWAAGSARSPESVSLGAFDLIIGATAIRYGFPVLTTNAADFGRMPGCQVEALE